MFKLIRNFFEIDFFGVSSWWSAKIGIKSSFIRLFFIYAVFVDAFTVLIYLIMVSILKLRVLFKFRKRRSVFDL